MSEEDIIKSIDEYFNLDKVEEGEAFKRGYFSAMYRIKNIWKQLEDKIKKRDKALDKIKNKCLENMYIDDRGEEVESIERDIKPSEILELLEEIE